MLLPSGSKTSDEVGAWPVGAEPTVGAGLHQQCPAGQKGTAYPGCPCSIWTSPARVVSRDNWIAACGQRSCWHQPLRPGEGLRNCPQRADPGRGRHRLQRTLPARCLLPCALYQSTAVPLACDCALHRACTEPACRFGADGRCLLWGERCSGRMSLVG